MPSSRTTTGPKDGTVLLSNMILILTEERFDRRLGGAIRRKEKEKGKKKKEEKEADLSLFMYV